VLEDLLARCRVRQLEQVSVSIAKRKPMMHDDFTRNFPRVLSIYVFSFLDPRSLCRCAQVRLVGWYRYKHRVDTFRRILVAHFLTHELQEFNLSIFLEHLTTDRKFLNINSEILVRNSEVLNQPTLTLLNQPTLTLLNQPTLTLLNQPTLTLLHRC